MTYVASPIPSATSEQPIFRKMKALNGQATFGKYVLLRKLATGGMGEVFLAKQVGPSGFEKLLVIKRILAHHHDKHEYLNMFLSEARLVAYLTHSNIIQIHEMGQIDGDYFIAMEYVRGKSLRDIIDQLRAQGRMLPLPYVVDLAIKLCDGLGYAHAARDIRGRPMNIIHRDINPHNVLVSYNGDLKLIDFGIAKSEMTSVHTATGTIKGKFVYMSPEQSAADPIDRRSDIFSLGIVMYEMTVLENPFVRQNVVLSLEAIQRHTVPTPGMKRGDAGPLAPILERALQKGADDRYQNCEEMRDDLRNLLRSGAVKPAETDLSTFLHDLFVEDIDEEDRLLAEADRATTPIPRQLEVAPAEGPDFGDAPRLPEARVDSARPAPGVPRSSSSQDSPTVEGRPARTPRPVAAAPFSDEEPTLAGDLEGLAARSRQFSSLLRAEAASPSPSPTGQVLTLIPPEDVAPGTSDELGAMIPEPHTRKDRVPADAPSSFSPLGVRPSPTADIVSGDPIRSDPPDPGDVAAAETADVSSSASLAAQDAFATSGSASAEDASEGETDHPDGASVHDIREARALADMRDAETREGAAAVRAVGTFDEPLSPGARFDARMAPTKEIRSTPPPPMGVSTPVDVPADALDLPPVADGPRDPSVLLPAYAGPFRRSMVIAAALVFVMTAVAGYWVTRSLTTSPQVRRDAAPAGIGSARAAPEAELAAMVPAAPVEPAPDPGPALAAEPVKIERDAAPEEVREPMGPPDLRDKKRVVKNRTPHGDAPDGERRRDRARSRGGAAENKRSEQDKLDESARRLAEPPPAPPPPEPAPEPKPESKPEPKKTPPPPPPPPAPKTEEARTPPPAPREDSKDTKGRRGVVTVRTSEGFTVEHDGQAAGSAPSSLIVRREMGTIKLSASDLGYTVTLSYRVSGDGLAVSVDSNPWAVVKHDGISLGKTPQGPVAAARQHRFSLLRPGQSTPLVVSLLWNGTP